MKMHFNMNYELPLLNPTPPPIISPSTPDMSTDASSPVVFMSLGHCHHHKHATTRGRRQGDGARGGGGGSVGWKNGRGGGWTRTTMGMMKKCQRREGTPSDDGLDNPFTVGNSPRDLTGGWDDPPGGTTGGGEDDR